MKLLLLGLTLSLVLVSCKNDVPDLPAKVLWEVIPNSEGCTYYPIVKSNPLTVGDGVDVTKDKCPYSIIGFSDDDSGYVFQYIRDLQKMAETRCK